MVKCPNCQAEIPPRSPYCPICKAKIAGGMFRGTQNKLPDSRTKGTQFPTGSIADAENNLIGAADLPRQEPAASAEAPAAPFSLASETHKKEAPSSLPSSDENEEDMDQGTETSENPHHDAAAIFPKEDAVKEMEEVSTEAGEKEEIDIIDSEEFFGFAEGSEADEARPAEEDKQKKKKLWEKKAKRKRTGKGNEVNINGFTREEAGYIAANRDGYYDPVEPDSQEAIAMSGLKMAVRILLIAAFIVALILIMRYVIR